MEALVPADSGDSRYAREGTAAHALGEIKAAAAFGHISYAVRDQRIRRWHKQEGAEFQAELPEIEFHTDAYVEYLQDRAKSNPGTVVMLEQRLDTGVPTCWGTSDAVLVSPEHVEIVDLKYGQGVKVEAAGNSQLRLYALGALDSYGDLLGDPKVVRYTVFQPRLNHVDSEELSPTQLREWRESILPVAKEALGKDARFGPSDEACRWCPASGRCKAQLEAVFGPEEDEFEVDPRTLNEDQIAAALGRLGLVRQWLKDFEAAALSAAYSDGKVIPGYKVVLSGGRRSVVDPDGARKTLSSNGFEEWQYMAPAKMRGIGELETLLGKVQFAEMLEAPGFVSKSEGNPSLVPDSDKRDSVQPNIEAAKEFGKELL